MKINVLRGEFGVVMVAKSSFDTSGDLVWKREKFTWY